MFGKKKKKEKREVMAFKILCSLVSTMPDLSNKAHINHAIKNCVDIADEFLKKIKK